MRLTVNGGRICTCASLRKTMRKSIMIATALPNASMNRIRSRALSLHRRRQSKAIIIASCTNATVRNDCQVAAHPPAGGLKVKPQGDGRSKGDHHDRPVNHHAKDSFHADIISKADYS